MNNTRTNQSSSCLPGDDSSQIGFTFITPIPSTLTGLSSYADSLIAAFSERNPNSKIILITNADHFIFERINGRPNIEIIALSGNSRRVYKVWSIFAHIRASVIAKSMHIRCLVSITTQGSFIPIVPQLIVVHDNYDLDRQYRSAFHVLYSRVIRKWSFRVARGIICVSDATFSELCSFLHPGTSKTIVIKEASKYEPVVLEAAQESACFSSRFLFVANIEKTKNVEFLLETLRLAQNCAPSIEVDWIGRDPANIIQSWIRMNGRLRNFHPQGFVTDNELRNAYRTCTALVVPSLKEGFCLPVLEAHAFGTPVIASDIAILREVVGGGGIFFDLSDPASMLNALISISSDPGLRLSLRCKAIENAGLYSWSRSAEKLERFAEERCGVKIIR